MKIQSLAIIFIIIILPITIIFSSYTQNQVLTLSLQMSYDTKLDNATYDAIKAFQMNSTNSNVSSELVESKIGDIEASINIFFYSMANNFSMGGYNKESLKLYVPALVYTLYDGYYIYSPYQNTLTGINVNSSSKYQDGEYIYGLKPYVYYSSRYKYNGADFTITYTLDNYITIQGIASDGKEINESGYLLSDLQKSGENYIYRGITFDKNGEQLMQEMVVYNNTKEILPCKKINGVKYYKKGNEVFSVINGKKYTNSGIKFENDDNAYQYYKQAYEFKNNETIKDILRNLKVSNAVDENGNKLFDVNSETDYKIFKGLYETSGAIEESQSNFNTHRQQVIKYSIERNLSIAISNYNSYGTSATATNFQMPKLKETDWDKILNNISMISFLQGLNIGGKVYNGYSIINNNLNREVVTEDSIYIVSDDGYYHRITEENLNENLNVSSNTLNGVFNMDFEKISYMDTGGNTSYYYPHSNLGSYDSIVSQRKVNSVENIYEYLEDKDKLAKIYYTALARERYGMFRVNN